MGGIPINSMESGYSIMKIGYRQIHRILVTFPNGQCGGTPRFLGNLYQVGD